MIALLTPMANPTVEREMRVMLPASVDYVVGRLVSDAADSSERLKSYARHLDRALAQFGGMTIDAIAFACTASSYLLGRDAEDAIAREIGLPVLWAAAEVRKALTARGVQSLAVISPYPDAIHAAGLAYWREAGFAIVHDAHVDIGSADTRAIYALTGKEADNAIAEAHAARPDAILLSGTGMPTAAAIAPDAAPPILSSNHCLAQAMIGAAA